MSFITTITSPEAMLTDTQAADNDTATQAKMMSKRPSKPAATATVTAPKPKASPNAGKTAKKAKAAATTKTEAVLKLLCGAKGATIDALMEATGWQAHSVRGFLSATVKRKLKLALISEVGKDGKNSVRHYRIAGGSAAKSRRAGASARNDAAKAAA